MRELKFRAWDKITKKYYVVSTLEYADNGELCEVWLADILVTEPNDACRNPKDVVLEQYTGLKDKNGKEIYEGDIVEQFVCGVHQFKGKSCGRRTIWQVRWNKEECCFELHYLYGSLFGDSMMSKGEEYVVIGNIHENPELLEEE